MGGILVAHRSHRLTQIILLQATVVTMPHSKKLRRSQKSVIICVICGKIQHSTLNIQHYNNVNGFTKLHQAGISPALFSGFRPGRGKSPSDEMDSKMHPALRAVAEEWIHQEHQGVQSPASILYFLPFGRALIFISENR